MPCHPQSALAGLNSRTEGLRLSGPVRRTEASMAGSRAASARESGQIREEAALSDTARAPRASLAGAEDRRARPRTSFEDGCTVRAFSMDHADLIRTLTEMWNAGDVDSVFDLYTEDAEIRTGPHWPEVTTYRGREAIRETSAEWASMWEHAPDRGRHAGGVRRQAGRDRRVADARRRQRHRRRDADLHRVHVQGGEDRGARVVRRPRPPSRPPATPDLDGGARRGRLGLAGQSAGCSAVGLVDRVRVLGEVVLGEDHGAGRDLLLGRVALERGDACWTPCAPMSPGFWATSACRRPSLRSWTCFGPASKQTIFTSPCLPASLRPLAAPSAENRFVAKMPFRSGFLASCALTIGAALSGWSWL